MTFIDNQSSAQLTFVISQVFRSTPFFYLRDKMTPKMLREDNFGLV